MFENEFKKGKVPLTTQNRLIIEQNAYRRAQLYYDQLMKSNHDREQYLRHRNAELVKKKQDLILMKGSLPSTSDTQKIKMENDKIQYENEIIQNYIIKIKSQIQQYNDLYNMLNIDYQDQYFSFQKLEQINLDHSYTAEQLKNIHLKAIEKYQKVDQKENDLIQLIFSLQKREKIVLKKERIIDLVLSDPLDNIELDEFLTKDIEDSLSELESKEQALDDSKLINEIENELVELEILSRKNQKRQKTLSVLKNSLKTQNQISSSSLKSPKSKRTIDQEKDLAILSPRDKVKIDQKIEIIIQNLNEKNKKYLKDSLEVDQLSIVNLKKCKELEKQYKIKILKIQNLEDQIDFATDLSSSIQNEQNQILLLTRNLQDLKLNKERIKHANSNAFQSIKVFESKKEDLKKLRSLVEIKMKELNKKELQINKRKAQYKKDQEDLDVQMNQLDDYEQNVYYLEDQAKIYEDKIKENCIEINESYSIIDEKTKFSLNFDRYSRNSSFS